MTTREHIIAAAKEAGAALFESQGELVAHLGETRVPDMIERLYAIAFEAGRVAEQEKVNQDAERYRWLRIHGLQRAWVSLGRDCDGKNFAEFKCEFKVPAPPNLPYEDDEGLEWADKYFDAAIDAAIAAARKEQSNG